MKGKLPYRMYLSVGYCFYEGISCGLWRYALVVVEFIAHMCFQSGSCVVGPVGKSIVKEGDHVVRVL